MTPGEPNQGLGSAAAAAETLPGAPRDGSGDMDTDCAAITASRDDYGQVLWLFGDSIFRGMALNAFPDKMSAAAIAAEPLWAFRSPAAMINLIAADQGLAVQDESGVVTSGGFVACYAGLSGQPGRIGKGVARIRNVFAAGHVRPGDVVAFLDAGMHTGDPDLYEAQWIKLLDAAAGEGVTLLMCNTFDNLAENQRATVGEDPREMFMYDIPFRGGVSGLERTHNDAIKAVATAPRTTAGEIRFLDMAAIIRDWRDQVRDRFDVAVYHPDNIHLNVWGQMKLAQALLKAVRPDAPNRTPGRFKEVVREHWLRLGYKTRSETWSRAAAMQLTKLCHGRG